MPDDHLPIRVIQADGSGCMHKWKLLLGFSHIDCKIAVLVVSRSLVVVLIDQVLPADSYAGKAKATLRALHSVN